MQQMTSDAAPARPSLDEVPEVYRDRISDLFDTWDHVKPRNRMLTRYYTMKNDIELLSPSIPEQFQNVAAVVGWASKAVHAHSGRSVFDGFVFEGRGDDSLDALVRRNRLRTLVSQATISSLVHGVAAFTVMRGAPGQPPVKVRSYSANQFSAIWDKDADRIACGVVLSDVDRWGRARRYTVHMPDAVLELTRYEDALGGERWACAVEHHKMGRPMMEVMANDPDPDRPMGHSMLTPELIGIINKAMRDVLRMDIGAEFFTFPQRWAVGVEDSIFSAPLPEGTLTDEDGDPVDGDGNKLSRPQLDALKWKAYVGAIWAFTRDENGDVPTLGQFPAADASSFTAVFENDAQRFSGATNVPLAQLGVLSNTYTSSDALGAANDPLILEVEQMNRRNAEALEEVARMMMAVREGVPLDALDERSANVQAYYRDPSMPTIAARADAWTKLAGADKSIVSTRVYYEGVGLSQATIDRLMAEKEQVSAISALDSIAKAVAVKGATSDGGQPNDGPDESPDGDGDGR